MRVERVSRRCGEIEIRPYRGEDVAALTAAVQESSDDLRQWMPWAHAEYGREDARTWIESREQAWDDGEAYSFAVMRSGQLATNEEADLITEEADDGQLLGGVGINRIDEQNRVGNVGYWVRTRATGRGVATTAVRLAARFGFERVGLSRLELFVSVGNEASRRVAEKVGARKEGLLRRRLRVQGRVDDAILYALLPDDLREPDRQK